MYKVNLYGADWCKPCREVKALLEELNLDYTFNDVDHTSDEVTQNLYKIPYMQFRNSDGEIVGTHTGAISKRHLLKLVQENGEQEG